MPFGGFRGAYFGSSQQNQVCAICHAPRAQQLLRRCSWCEQFPVCSNCMLRVEENPEARLCFLCAVPKCNTCGWQGEDVQTLQYFYPTGRQDMPAHLCPSCQHHEEVVASHTGRRVPQGYYGSSDALRIDARARTDVEEALKNVGWGSPPSRDEARFGEAKPAPKGRAFSCTFSWVWVTVTVNLEI